MLTPMSGPQPRSRRPFYVVLVPVLWVSGVWIGFQFPGDEYALWVISALPGAWIGFVLTDVGDLGAFLPKVLLAGGLILVGVGWVMDRLRVPFRPWALGVLLGTVGLCFQTIGEFPSYARAISKNGSLAAYVLFGWNLSVVLASVIGIAITSLVRWFCRRAEKPR